MYRTRPLWAVLWIGQQSSHQGTNSVADVMKILGAGAFLSVAASCGKDKERETLLATLSCSDPA